VPEGWRENMAKNQSMSRKGLLVSAISVALTAGAAIAATAYFFWLAPSQGPAGESGVMNAVSTKPPAKKEEAKGKGRGAPAPVTVATIVEADMPVILTAPGTVEPLANVAVKPRVDGQIVEVAFREGDLVEKDSVLFRLDDRLVRSQIAQAEANVAKEQASLREAESTLARRQALIDKQVVTEAALDQARHAVEGLKASISAGRALVESYKTQLDYLTIRAPITGRTGSLAAKLGAQVRAQDANALVTINQTRPILVSFSLPQRELAPLRRALNTKAQAQVTVPGGQRLAVPATIAFIDNQVDKTTGAITVKVQADNTDEALWPGQSVEVALTVEVKSRMLSAPATAVQPAQQGMITWVIGSDNKVTPKVVTVERIVGQTVFLSGGVAAGDRVVTDGQMRLAPGTTVIIDEPGRAAPGKAQDKKALEKAPRRALIDERLDERLAAGRG
jgi:membrane fusion protein, multidrug efflux system